MHVFQCTGSSKERLESYSIKQYRTVCTIAATVRPPSPELVPVTTTAIVTRGVAGYTHSAGSHGY